MPSIANLAEAAAPGIIDPPVPSPRRLRLGFLMHLHVGADAADSYRIALDLFEAALQNRSDSQLAAVDHTVDRAWQQQVRGKLAVTPVVADRARRAARRR